MCRLLTLLLLTSLLLTQWASSNRCLGECGVTGIDRGRPHVHLDAIFPIQGDNDGCCRNCPRRSTPPVAVEGTAASSSSDPRATPSDPVPPCGKDGVLFLSSDLGLGLPAAGGSDRGQDGLEQFVGVAELSLALSRQRVDHDPCPHPTPLAHALPVYLRSLRLLV
jgi:hypothetical protein